jgi:signal peptidase II
MSYWKLSSSKPVVGFSIMIDIFILDQITKWLILEYVMRNEVQPNSLAKGLFDWIANPSPRFGQASVELLPFFNLTMVWNEGISFGVLSNWGIWPLSIASLIIAALFAVWLTKATGWIQAIGLGMIIGGAIGNVVDRFRFGAVADFFDFHAYGWHYPAFNIADCGITVGVVLLVIDGLFLEPKRKVQHTDKSVTV